MQNLSIKKSFISLSILSTALVSTGCSPVKQAEVGLSKVTSSIKETFNSDDPCSNNARNIGILAGTIGGAFIASKLGDDVAGVVVGAALGATIGGFIGQDIDNRRCELHKISQKYKVPIKSEPISLASAGIDIKNSNTFKKEDSAGLKVNLQDTGQQFKTGSAKLTPKAKEYFIKIAQSYSPKYNQSKNQEKNQVLKSRQILIIGHTDDVGDSNSNAILAEQRALAVAQIFQSQGISKANIHYQGAGETQPIADNRTAEGRAQNRRAEIIDLPDQTTLYSYLERRKPVVAYYRPKTVIQTQKRQEDTTALVPKTEHNMAQHTKAQKTKQSATKITEKWQFNGHKLTENNASVSVGDVIPPEDKLAFMSVFGISTAQASSDVVYTHSCSVDKPRISKSVKSLATGKEITLKTKDYLPGLNKTVWIGDAGKHKIALSGVAVPRDASNGISDPKVSFYPSNKLTKNSKPAFSSVAQANAYHGKNGVLYRLFFDEKAPVQCMDIVMPSKAPFNAQTGYMIYPKQQNKYVTDFKPSKI